MPRQVKLIFIFVDKKVTNLLLIFGITFKTLQPFFLPQDQKNNSFKWWLSPLGTKASYNEVRS